MIDFSEAPKGISPPVWIVADMAMVEENYRLTAKSLAIYMVDEFGKVFHLFATAEIATTFIKNSGDLKTHGAYSLKTAKAMKQTLEYMERTGVQYVGINITNPSDGSPKSYLPIRRAIESIADPGNN